MAKPIRNAFGSVITRPGRRGFYLRIRYRGQQRVRSAGTSKKTLANELLAQIHAACARSHDLDDALNQVLGPNRNKTSSVSKATAAMVPTFADVAGRYHEVRTDIRESTRREDKKRLSVITEAPWASKPIDQITKADIAYWLDEIGTTRKDGEGLAPSTQNRYRSLVSVIFNYALDRDLVTENPVARLKRADESGRQREEYLTPPECLAFIAHCPAALHLMIVTAAVTGVRAGVLRHLRWRDLDLDAGTMRVRASIAKGKKAQVFPLVDYVVKQLRLRLETLEDRQGLGDEVVFRTKTGRPWSRSWLCQVVRRAVDTCPGIPATKRREISFHSLRHSYGTLLAEDDLEFRKLQEAMSHSDPRLTARYTHVNAKAMKEAAEKIGRILRLDGADEVGEGYHRGYQASSGG